MHPSSFKPDYSLLGVGLYTPSEAERLIGVPSGKLARWLRGHAIGANRYLPLWTPQIATSDGELCLGFLDLMQARVAAALIGVGLSARKVRRAIDLAGTILASDHPFAHARFRTDGRTLILDGLQPGEDDPLIDLFRQGQYVMRTVIEPSLRDIEFDANVAVRWWPAGKRAGIVVDPARQFGRSIEAQTGVPTDILSNAVAAEGSVEAAALAFGVPAIAVRRAAAYEAQRAA